MRRADPMYRAVVLMSVCFGCCVLSVKGLCDVQIPCTVESYDYLSVMFVVCCQLEICATGWSLHMKMNEYGPGFDSATNRNEYKE